uniref:Uncharacterized protein n=1 Tax=Pseudo-nitzschia australis TaxID=44445 RepID=A0A7S4AWS3_9STRA
MQSLHNYIARTRTKARTEWLISIRKKFQAIIMTGKHVHCANECLIGLVTLMHLVRDDDIDSSALIEEKRRLNSRSSRINTSKRTSNRGGSSTHNKHSSTRNDALILELIQKLRLAQKDSPKVSGAVR